MKTWRIFWKAKAKDSSKDPLEAYILRSKYEIVRAQFKRNKSANFTPKLYNRHLMLMKVASKKQHKEAKIKAQEKDTSGTPSNVIVRASGLKAYIGDPIRKIFSRSVGRNSFLYDVNFLHKELNKDYVIKRGNSLKDWILDEYVYAPKVNWWFLEQPPAYLNISYAERHCYWVFSVGKSVCGYIASLAPKLTIDTSNLQNYSIHIKWILIFVAYIIYRFNTEWVVYVQSCFLRIKKSLKYTKH